MSPHLSEAGGSTSVLSAFVRVPTQRSAEKATENRFLFFLFFSFPWRPLFSARQLNAILAAEIRMSTKTNRLAIKGQKKRKT